ncbi:hypothetical protein ACTVPT_24665 [Serratia bockelmannii]|uniref:hypothetical protein n=1 Tax=Serratia TaxID=613 RepID=UPI00146DEEAD|nr:hypothetical protein [Serratia marcescens]NMT27094.1 hypothetical protein [Serratia marcescens]
MGYRTVAVIQRPAGEVRPNGLCLSRLCITWEKAISAPFNGGNPDNDFVFFINLIFYSFISSFFELKECQSYTKMKV